MSLKEDVDAEEDGLETNHMLKVKWKFLRASALQLSPETRGQVLDGND